MTLMYNFKEIESILIDIHNLTKFRIAIFDNNFQELLSYPNRLSSFCKIVRSDSTLNNKCRKCDFYHFSECEKTKEPIIYTCHAGLSEMIIPISSTGLIIGYIMLGQIYCCDMPRTEIRKIYNTLCNFDIDINKLRIVSNTVPKVSKSNINSACNLTNICANHLQESGKISLNPNTLAYKIDKYILDNLTNDLDVSILCNEFKYNKTTFYKITNKIYGIGIMKHIRKLRIHKAKNLLSSTDLPISEIASMVGINDYNYFSKIFKQEALCTPREFRKVNFSNNYHKEIE